MDYASPSNQEPTNQDPAPDAPPPSPSETPDPGASSSTPDAPSGEFDAANVLNMISDVESQLHRIRSAQKSHEEEVRSLAEQRAEVESARRTLEESRQALEDARAALEQERQSVEASARETAEAQTALEQTRETLDARAHELEQREAAIAEQESSAAAQRESIDAAQREIDERRHALETQVRAHEAALRGQEDEAAAIEKRRLQLDVRTAALEEESRRLEAREEQVAERERSLNEAQTQFESEQSAHAEQVRRAASFEQERGQLEAQIEALRRETSERTEALEAKASALQEAQAALDAEKARAADAEAAQAESERIFDETRSSLEQQLEERSELLSVERANLAKAGEKLRELSQAIQQQGDSFERGMAAIELSARQAEELESCRTKITELEAQVASGGSSGDAAALQDMQARLREVEGALDEAERKAASAPALEAKVQELESALASAQATGGDDSASAARIAELERALADALAKAEASTPDEAAVATIAELQGRIESLEGELVEARRQIEAGVAAETGPRVNELRETARRIKVAAKNLQVRRDRLRRARRLMRERGPGEGGGKADYELRARQMREMQQQRQAVLEAQSALAASERKMIRRWSRGRAIVSVTMIFILAAIFAGGSWLAADQFFPAEIAASVTLRAKSRNDQGLTPKEIEQWKQTQSELVRHEAFHNTLLDRLEDRRIDTFGSAAALGAHLADHLTLDTAGENEITLTLTGENPDATMMLLDTLAASLATESAKQVASHRGRARSVIAAEREENGHVRYSTLNPIPIMDQRLERAGIIFGGSFTGALLLILIVYLRLARAKRVFDESEIDIDAIAPAEAA